MTAKRLLDVLVSFIGLILLAFPFAVITLAIKLDSKGPIFFRQKRVGKGENLFKVWKFRTMKVRAPEKGFGHEVAKDNPYVTRTGQFLREWGLDELPQLINVFFGQMSIVGPRPALRWQVEGYNNFQRQRLSFKPGITGWALVHGRRSISWKKRIELEIWYIENYSLCLDIKIMVKTLYVILLKREGVYSEDDFKL